MRITVNITTPGARDLNLLSLEVFPEMSIEALRSSIHAETQIEPSAQHLYHNGDLIMDNDKTMEQLSIADGEMLALHVRDVRGSTGVPAAGNPRAAQEQQQPRQNPSRPAAANQTDPELIRLQILGNPQSRAELQRTNPQLAAVLDDRERFTAAFREAADRERRDRSERQRQIALLNEDPFNIEAQAKIEEIIRQERVMENLQNAMEHNPEGRQTLRSNHEKQTHLLTYAQSLAVFTCSTSMSKSTVTRSKHLLTRAPRQPSCRLRPQKPVVSCVWLTSATRV